MHPLESLRSQINQIEDILGTPFENKDLLILAFTHRSFVNENRDRVDQHNERLEFLGDSVLGLAVAEFLYRRLPACPEGQLSQFRSRIVDAPSCAKYLKKLELGGYILLGRGERFSSVNEGKAKESILADAFEALVGAIYLDGGMTVVRSFLLHHFESEFEEAIGSPSRNYKAELQDYSQKKFQRPSQYRVIEESGPDHAKIFHIAVTVGDSIEGVGMGSSKKEAEQRAAFEALAKIPP